MDCQHRKQSCWITFRHSQKSSTRSSDWFIGSRTGRSILLQTENIQHIWKRFPMTCCHSMIIDLTSRRSRLENSVKIARHWSTTSKPISDREESKKTNLTAASIHATCRPTDVARYHQFNWMIEVNASHVWWNMFKGTERDLTREREQSWLKW